MSDSPFEKSGNSNWAQCPNCDHWFHVAPALLRMTDVNLICPGCGHQFVSKDAKELLKN
ncbi:MAG: MJ0042-type zinc finger domain-containing protein [Pseudomonadota bacterium]|nr:MJ0042-type zinc finger domain-containing protein [Pseudomonadota bacterium]MEC8726915.1 MJ0042-type zinc finger domain-containing protein [Pseudomonadota bacterium]